MRQWMMRALATAFTFIFATGAASSQQADTSATCGFSRIDFSQLHQWFRPAAAHTTRKAALLAAPKAGATLLKLIPTGERVYVVSDAPRAHWCHAIDPATGKVGWMDVEALEVESGVSMDSTTAAAGYDGPLKQIPCLRQSGNDSTGTWLRIVNHYPVALKLLAGDKTYTVPRAPVGKTSVLTIRLKAGRQGYVIVVPDSEIVDVFFGYADLRASRCYQYEVEIQSIE